MQQCQRLAMLDKVKLRYDWANGCFGEDARLCVTRLRMVEMGCSCQFLIRQFHLLLSMLPSGISACNLSLFIFFSDLSLRPDCQKVISLAKVPEGYCIAGNLLPSIATGMDCSRSCQIGLEPRLRSHVNDTGQLCVCACHPEGFPSG